MVKFLTSVVVSLPLAAFALPSAVSPRSLQIPREANKVVFDENNKRFIAFDRAGRELGADPLNATLPFSRRGAGTCTPMSNEDIDKSKVHWCH